MDDEASRPRIRTQAELEQLWRRLMSPLGFSRHTLWMVVIVADRPVPQIMEIVDAADIPGDDDIASFARVLERLAGPDTRFAFLRTRPGGGRADTLDRAWARALHAAGRRAGAAVDTVHLAHDHDVLPIVLDDLLAEPA
jgi:hypothetical protein